MMSKLGGEPGTGGTWPRRRAGRIMLFMPATNATRLMLIADGPRAVDGSSTPKVRRYRLARMPLDAAVRAAGEPRYDYLKRSYD